MAGANGSTSASGYADMALVSDGVVAAGHTDAQLQNPWGLAFAPGGPFWIADNNDSLATVYDGNGVPGTPVVTLPAATNGPANPSGEVYNGTSDFPVGSGAGATPARFLFDGEGGTILGWAAGSSAVVLYDDGVANGALAAVYKGLALASNGGVNYLYATDLRNAKVDVFDGAFQKVSNGGGAFAGKFVDPALPAGYAPFGIALVNGQLYVTYAQPDASATDENTGAGLGVVDIFDTAGNFVQRFASGGALNAPWGLVVAPAGFGTAAGDLLVGNFGDGSIQRYTLGSGLYLGALATPAGTALAIPGLWSLAFGNGALNATADALYYTAGPSSQHDGVFGRIVYTSGSGGSGY
jgi:uncharacterized protein (TIGR03118 family)